jgi:hypothetical protein
VAAKTTHLAGFPFDVVRFDLCPSDVDKVFNISESFQRVAPRGADEPRVNPRHSEPAEIKGFGPDRAGRRNENRSVHERLRCVAPRSLVDGAPSAFDSDRSSSGFDVSTF